MSSWRRLVQQPAVRIATFYLIWQGVTLGIIGGLYRTVPSLYSQGLVRFWLTGAVPAVAAAIAFWTMLRFVNRRSWASFGFSRVGLVTGTLLGFLLGVLAYAGYMAMSWSGGWYHVISINEDYYLPYILVFFLFVGIAEETVFRGYIFQTLEGRWGTTAALIGSSLLFGLAHVIYAKSGYRWHDGHLLEGVISPILQGFTGGILFSAAFLLTRRMWIPIALHWAWDTCSTLFFDAPGFGIRSYYQATLDEPAYRISGAAFWLGLGIDLILGLLLLGIAIRKGHWQAFKGHNAPAPLPLS